MQTNLLTRGNPKVLKGESQGYLTFILHLAPASLSGYNTCASATDGLRMSVRAGAGQGACRNQPSSAATTRSPA